MKALKSILLGSAAILGIAAIASCSKENKMIGTWETSSPSAVVPTLPGTVATTQVTTFEFCEGKDAKSGPVKLTARYELTLPADSTGLTHNSTISATIEGTWTRDDKDDDDYFLAFDRNSLNVNAISAPELGPATDVFMSGLAKLGQIEDVEVNKEKTILTFEDQADTKYVLSKVTL